MQAFPIFAAGWVYTLARVVLTQVVLGTGRAVKQVSTLAQAILAHTVQAAVWVSN